MPINNQISSMIPLHTQYIFIFYGLVPRVTTRQWNQEFINICLRYISAYLSALWTFSLCAKIQGHFLKKKTPIPLFHFHCLHKLCLQCFWVGKHFCFPSARWLVSSSCRSAASCRWKIKVEMCVRDNFHYGYSFNGSR